jgi:hypothetical protein
VAGARQFTWQPWHTQRSHYRQDDVENDENDENDVWWYDCSCWVGHAASFGLFVYSFD